MIRHNQFLMIFRFFTFKYCTDTCLCWGCICNIVVIHSDDPMVLALYVLTMMVRRMSECFLGKRNYESYRHFHSLIGSNQGAASKSSSPCRRIIVQPKMLAGLPVERGALCCHSIGCVGFHLRDESKPISLRYPAS